MNSELLLTYSRHFAETLSKRASEPGEQIEAAWQAIYCRHPSAAERDATVKFLAEQRTTFEQQAAYKDSSGKSASKSAELEALAVMCQMLMGSNEFLYVD